MRFIICLFTLLISLSFQAQNGDALAYHTVSPKNGDGILSLLSRYNLNENICDINHFYEINRLKKGDNIYTHRMYKLPIILYTYNNKNIRSTIGDNDWDKAVRIKDYNEKLKDKGIRRTHYTDSKILWVRYSELFCDNSKQTEIKEAIQEKNSNILNVPYFGEDYQKVEIKDYSLKNKVYYIVSGHGGPDPGARCVDCYKTICEDEYAYDIGLRLARELMEHGAIVHMIIQDKDDGIRDEKFLTCDRDERLLGKSQLPLNQKKRLNQRAAAINKLFRAHKKNGIKDQLAIFLHIDSNSASKEQDVYFYHHKKSRKGKKVATNVQKTFAKKYEKYQKGRGYTGHVSPRGLYVLNYTQPVSVFIELGNIRNSENHRRILPNTNRQALAKWIREGVSL